MYQDWLLLECNLFDSYAWGCWSRSRIRYYWFAFGFFHFSNCRARAKDFGWTVRSFSCYMLSAFGFGLGANGSLNNDLPRLNRRSFLQLLATLSLSSVLVTIDAASNLSTLPRSSL